MKLLVWTLLLAATTMWHTTAAIAERVTIEFRAPITGILSYATPPGQEVSSSRHQHAVLGMLDEVRLLQERNRLYQEFINSEHLRSKEYKTANPTVQRESYWQNGPLSSANYSLKLSGNNKITHLSTNCNSDARKAPERYGMMFVIENPELYIQLEDSVSDLHFAEESLREMERRLDQFKDFGTRKGIGSKQLSLELFQRSVEYYQMELARPNNDEKSHAYKTFYEALKGIGRIGHELSSHSIAETQREMERLIKTASRDRDRSRSRASITKYNICLGHVFCPIGYSCKISSQSALKGQWVSAGDIVMKVEATAQE